MSVDWHWLTVHAECEQGEERTGTCTGTGTLYPLLVQVVVVKFLPPMMPFRGPLTMIFILASWVNGV